MKYGIGRMQNKIYYNKESNKDKFLDGKCVLLMILKQNDDWRDQKVK